MSKDHKTALKIIETLEVGSDFSSADRETAVDAASQGGSLTSEPTKNTLELDQSAVEVSRILDGLERDSAREAPIEFRVIRSGAPNRRLRLAGKRYTFGQGEDCSIRLSDPALRPMHAVLIRDASRILVRAYSVPVLVNGHRKPEATLHPGDVLELGNYRFELLRTETRQTAPLNPEWTAGPQSVLAPAFHPHVEKPMVGNDSVLLPNLQWQERLRREIDQWRDRQTECDRRENRCDEREAKLRSRESELWTRAETLHQRESRLQSQESAAFQLSDGYTQHQQELLQLREETRYHQENYDRREAEFRNVEFEYRHRLEEAARQLQQSRLQAESSTEAVQKMRAEFDSLNRQIEELSDQQPNIDQLGQKETDTHLRLRQELEEERDNALDQRDESNRRCQAAEARVEEMSAQLDSLLTGDQTEQQTESETLQQSQLEVEQLRRQVERLQQNVDEASRKSEQYRADYEEACTSITQLESLVERSSERGDKDKKEWAAETNELRSAIDELSIDLAQANGDLSELSQANAILTTRLNEMQSERDQVRQELESRPSQAEFKAMQSELESTGQQLLLLREKYSRTEAELEQSKRELGRIDAESSHAASESDESSQPSFIWSTTEDTPPIQHQDAYKPLETAVESEMLVSDNSTGSKWGQFAAQDTDGQTANADQNQSDLTHTFRGHSPAAEKTPADSATTESIRAMKEPWATNQSTTESSQETELKPFASGVINPDQSPSPMTDLSDTEDHNSWPNSDNAKAVTLNSNWDAEEGFAEAPTTNQVDGAETTGKEPDNKIYSWGDIAEPAPENSAEDKNPAEAANENSPLPSEVSAWDQHEPSCNFATQDDESSATWDQRQPSESNKALDGSLASILLADIASDRNIDQASSVDALWAQTFQTDQSEQSASNHGPIQEITADQAELNEPHNDQDFSEDTLSDLWATSSDNQHVDDHQPGVKGQIDEQHESQDPLTEISSHTRAWPHISSGSDLTPDTNDDSQCNSEHHDKSHLSPNNEEGIDEQNVSSEQGETSDASADSATESFQDLAESTTDSVATDEITMEDEGSIEAYMNRLLQRVQDPGSDSTDTTEAMTISNSLPSSDSSAVAEQKEKPEEAEAIAPLAPLVPRSQTSEKASDLRTLRALANQTNRNANAQNNRVLTRDIQMKGMFNFACTAGAIVCGIACYFFLPGLIRLVAVAMTLIVATVYGREGFQTLTEANSQSLSDSK